jgi:hypothetical protein
VAGSFIWPLTSSFDLTEEMSNVASSMIFEEIAVKVSNNAAWHFSGFPGWQEY